jgi:hypothetical protein
MINVWYLTSTIQLIKYRQLSIIRGGLTGLRINRGSPTAPLTAMPYKEFTHASELTSVCHCLRQQQVKVWVCRGKVACGI